MELSHIKLRIVDTRDILLHEEVDPARVQRIQTALEESDVLRNPPVVALVSGTPERYMVLDGATRTTALRNLEYPLSLVQIVEYGAAGVRPEAWHHIIPDLTASGIKKELENSSLGTTVATTQEDAELGLAERYYAAYIYCSGRYHAIETSNAGFEAQVELLRRLVLWYKSNTEIYRLAQADLERVVRERETESSIVVFPKFTTDEIQQIALSGNLLPAGITRHIIPGRALNVHVPLLALNSTQSLEESNRWLSSWLTEKIISSKVRYYHEPVFVFDE